MKKSVIIIGAIILLIVLIQFIRIDKENPQSNPQYEYFAVSQVPEQVQSILKKSCFDCHSNHTLYPWYSSIAPASWMLARHIKEGREHLNFSEWGNYSLKDRMEMAEDIIEQIEDGEMPLKSYVLIHKDAKLSNEEKEIIRSQFLKESATGVVASLN